MYQIRYQINLAKKCKKFPLKDQNAIIKAIEGLQHNPRPEGVCKLKGYDDGYRIRVGNYRILYQIKDKILFVVIIDVEGRADIYKNL